MYVLVKPISSLPFPLLTHTRTTHLLPSNLCLIFMSFFLFGFVFALGTAAFNQGRTCGHGVLLSTVEHNSPMASTLKTISDFPPGLPLAPFGVEGP